MSPQLPSLVNRKMMEYLYDLSLRALELLVIVPKRLVDATNFASLKAYDAQVCHTRAWLLRPEGKTESG